MASRTTLMNKKNVGADTGAGAMRSSGMRPFELTDRTEKRKRKIQHV
jgi:hypothetical protein